MATDGMWTMTPDGEFVLDETYAAKLGEARTRATEAWTMAMLSYLVEQTPYSFGQLKDELVRRCAEGGMSPDEIVDEFVLEALGGDL